MDKSTLRIVSKAGLLLVITGFFMPVACDLNGLQIAESMSDMAGSNLLSIGLYALFGFSCIGMFLLLILIVKRPVNIVWDWIILAGACISALAAFGQMDELGRELGELSGFFGGFGTASGNSNRLQPGAYVILIGLIISLLSLIMASTRKENKLLLDPFNKINHY